MTIKVMITEENHLSGDFFFYFALQNDCKGTNYNKINVGCAVVLATPYGLADAS